VAVERTGEAENPGADGESLDLEGNHPFARDAGDLIVARMARSTRPKGECRKFCKEKNRDGEESEDDREIDEVEILRADAAAPGAGNARDAIVPLVSQSRAGDDAHDPLKSPANDGEIIAAQPRRDPAP